MPQNSLSRGQRASLALRWEAGVSVLACLVFVLLTLASASMTLSMARALWITRDLDLVPLVLLGLALCGVMVFGVLGAAGVVQ